MQYWNDITTKKSWEILHNLKTKFKFILIGGWAAYLWNNASKSKDIDIIIDFNTLNKLKQEYNLIKNPHLKKYEIKINEIDIDIYVPFYSELPLPLHKIESTIIQGIQTIKVEELIILKQGAEIQRTHSSKGEKDRIDILNLIINCTIDFSRYYKILKQNKTTTYLTHLTNLIKSAQHITYSKYLNPIQTPAQFKKQKQQILNKLKQLR